MADMSTLGACLHVYILSWDSLYFFNFESFDAKCELVIGKLQKYIVQLNLPTQMLVA
jgi:hypothetical protein